jgi:DNA-binding MarR family transcriptional regulator
MAIKNELITALIKFNDHYERCHRELSREIPVGELKIKQLRYIEIIGKSSSLTFSQFAEKLQITKPSVTSIINQLIKLECVRKNQCSMDGRKFFIELTPKGEKITLFNNLKQKRLAEKIHLVLSEREIELFIEILNKIVNI